MRILILGDPHGKIPKSSKADLILCTGDLGNADLIREYFFKYTLNDLNWHKILPKKEIKEAYEQTINSSIEVINSLGKTNIPVLLIFGNADLLDKDVKELNKKFKFKLNSLEREIKKFKNIKVIHKIVVRFKGLKIAGLNYSNKDRDIKFLNKTKELDILLNHSPPYKILDLAMPIKKHLGSKIILKYIKLAKPRYLICGHIHEAKGIKKFEETTVINAGQKSKIILP